MLKRFDGKQARPREPYNSYRDKKKDNSLYIHKEEEKDKPKQPDGEPHGK